jgi:ATP-dependent DNA helicase RecQ
LETPFTILHKYWKHTSFRPLQEEIITSVLAGHDTLALLPTGGGKSVCFQVPAMLLNGLCIVVSPLIALMKDQVENLKRKGILAVAVHSGMSRSEIDIHLNNCVFGNTKFLYISPERLQTELFQARVKQMKVALLAIDEAHCISQWGYDFRPPYLKIAELRKVIGDVPVIALTATATPIVADDITSKLEFRKGSETFQQTFARDNLSFVIRETENKNRKLLEILQKVKGSSIVYVRSRKATQEFAEFLTKNGISATYYHAGLTFEQRTSHQDEWIKDKVRVVVATNAFGMGIDKPNVRVVVHLDIPENLESYYQEAGRAGRDGKHSYAVIIFHHADVSSLITKIQQSHPSAEYLGKVYQALANYFQLAYGSAEGESFDFELHQFSDRFKFNMHEVYSALKKLEEEGLIQFNESFYSPSQLYFLADNAELYQFQIANERFDPVIKMLLRLYGGQLSNEFTKISESYLATALHIPVREVVELLKHLHELKLINYNPAKDKPQLTFVLARQDAEQLPLNLKRLAERRELAESKMNSIINYVTSTHRCRMQLIQDYFGEETFIHCGKCDVCIAERKKVNVVEIKELHEEIVKILKEKTFSVEELEERIAPKDSEMFIDVVREMVDQGVIEYDATWKLHVTGLNKN